MVQLIFIANINYSIPNKFVKIQPIGGEGATRSITTSRTSYR